MKEHVIKPTFTVYTIIPKAIHDETRNSWRSDLALYRSPEERTRITASLLKAFDLEDYGPDSARSSFSEGWQGGQDRTTDGGTSETASTWNGKELERGDVIGDDADSIATSLPDTISEKTSTTSPFSSFTAAEKEECHEPQIFIPWKEEVRDQTGSRMTERENQVTSGSKVATEASRTGTTTAYNPSVTTTSMTSKGPQLGLSPHDSVVRRAAISDNTSETNDGRNDGGCFGGAQKRSTRSNPISRLMSTCKKGLKKTWHTMRHSQPHTTPVQPAPTTSLTDAQVGWHEWKNDTEKLLYDDEEGVFSEWGMTVEDYWKRNKDAYWE